jgi:hypothetical protein
MEQWRAEHSALIAKMILLPWLSDISISTLMSVVMTKFPVGTQFCHGFKSTEWALKLELLLYKLSEHVRMFGLLGG